MLAQKVRKTGNSYVITIPKEEVERLNIADGDFVGVELRKATLVYELSPEVEAAYRRSWEARERAYRYLAEH